MATTFRRPRNLHNFAFGYSTMLSSIRTSVSKSQRHVLVSLQLVETSSEIVDDGEILRTEQVEEKTIGSSPPQRKWHFLTLSFADLSLVCRGM
jgi:hypothetical protein